MKLALSITLLFIVVSCTTTVDLNVGNIDSVEVTRKSDNGFNLIDFTKENAIKTTVYLNDSRELKKLKEWLALNKSGWTTYYATPAEGEIIIDGESFSLNVLSNFVILSYDKNGVRSGLLSKEINENEFEYFTKP